MTSIDHEPETVFPVPARQPAYDAIYTLIRALGDHMPVSPVHRNALIWRAIETALDAMDESGRLLPSGGEVSSQWAVRWYLVDGRMDEQDCFDNARETAEQRARHLATRLPRDALRGEVLNRVTYVGPWVPVVSDNSTEEPA